MTTLPRKISLLSAVVVQNLRYTKKHVSHIEIIEIQTQPLDPLRIRAVFIARKIRATLPELSSKGYLIQAHYPFLLQRLLHIYASHQMARFLEMNV